MGKAPQSTLTHSLSLVEFILLNTILVWARRVQKLSLGLVSLLLARPSRRQQWAKDESGEVQISRDDVEMIMGCMGMACSNDHGEQLNELLGSDELAAIFQETETSIGEVEAAFSVFDENHDGFIDAMELKGVLSKLGLGEGLPMDSFQRMISAYDNDRDGRIDFNEFAEFMESIIC